MTIDPCRRGGRARVVVAALLAAMVSAATAEDETHPPRQIRLRKTEDTPRRYDRNMEIHDGLFHMQRPTRDKGDYAEDLGIPETPDRPYQMLELEQPSPYGYEPIVEQPGEQEERKKNWILPPTPDDLDESTDGPPSGPEDLIQRAIEDEEAARRSILDSLYGGRGSDPEADGESTSGDETYDLSGNRIREASANLLYTDSDETDRLDGEDQTGITSGLDYRPVVSDRVLGEDELDRGRQTQAQTLTDEQLENMSVEQLEELAREQSGEEEETLRIAEEEGMQNVTRFTRSTEGEGGGLWQTRQMLAEMNGAGRIEAEEADAPAQAEAGQLSRAEWKNTLSGLAAALDSTTSRYGSESAVGRASEYDDAGFSPEAVPGDIRISDPSMGRIRSQFDFGPVQPTSDFAAPGAPGGVGQPGGWSGPEIGGTGGIGQGSVPGTPASAAAAAVGNLGRESAPAKRRGIDVRNLDILMN